MEEKKEPVILRVTLELGPTWFLVVVAVCVAVATLRFISP